MFSWEQVQIRRDSTLVAVMEHKTKLSLDWAISFRDLQMPAIWRFARIGGLPFDEVRNRMVTEALNGGYSYLFMLDLDICDYPRDALMRLISRRLPIVSALYHQRFPSWVGLEGLYLPAAWNDGRDSAGNPMAVPITEMQYGQLMEVAYVGAGFLLIHRSVFEAMLAAGIRRFFEWTMHVDKPGLSEDFDFCLKARRLGFKVWLDTSVQVVHETDAKIGVRGLQPRL